MASMTLFVLPFLFLAPLPAWSFRHSIHTASSGQVISLDSNTSNKFERTEEQGGEDSDTAGNSLEVILKQILQNLFKRQKTGGTMMFPGKKVPYSMIRVAQTDIFTCPEGSEACIDLYIEDPKKQIIVECAQYRTLPQEAKKTSNMTAEELNADLYADYARGGDKGVAAMIYQRGADAGSWLARFEGVAEVLAKARVTELKVKINQVTWVEQNSLWTCGTLRVSVTIPGVILRVQKGASSLTGPPWQLEIDTSKVDTTDCPPGRPNALTALDLISALDLNNLVGGVLEEILRPVIRDAVADAIDPWTKTSAVRAALAVGRAGNGLISSGTEWTC